MITEFRPVAWGDGEPVSSAKLAMMAANEQFLFEAMPKLYFSNGNIKKDRGVKILGVTSVIPAQASNFASTTVYFGDTFSVGCFPVVSMGINAGPRMRYHAVLNGIGVRQPDHRGVVISLAADEPTDPLAKITNNVYINLIALGF